MKTNSKIIFILLTLLISCLTGCNKKYQYNDYKYSQIKYKNLIIIIGDGMGTEHVSALNLVNDNVKFTDWNNAFSNTNSYGSNDLFITHTTDSAAGGSALATGVITNNGFIGKDKNGNDLETILDYAKSLNKSTGVITTDKLYGATPMSFSSHSLSRENTEELINNQLVSNVDVLMGNYSSTYNSKIADIESNNYTYVTDINNIDTSISSKLLYQENLEETDGSIKLVDMVSKGLDILDNNSNGYCLMIEQAYIDKCSHNNDFDGMIKSINSLNDTVNYLIDNVSNDTAILITADHETGELRVSSGNDLANSYTYNERIITYSYGSTSHSKNYVPVYTNFDYEFSNLEFYKLDHLIKNSDVYYICKDILE